MTLRRHYWDKAARLPYECEIGTSDVDAGVLLEVAIDGEPVRVYRGLDFEDALQALRADFESRERLLLVNRFRQNACVSSLSRQMSHGLRCYLVEPRRPVDPSTLVNCLDPAPESEVVTEAEARAFIARWQSQAPWHVRFPLVRWLSRLRD